MTLHGGARGLRRSPPQQFAPCSWPFTSEAHKPATLAPPTAGPEPNDVLVLAKHLNKVENVNQLQLVWKNLDTPEGKQVADGIANYLWGCSNCGSEAINIVDAVVGHTKDQGEDHTGYIRYSQGLYCLSRIRAKSISDLQWLPDGRRSCQQRDRWLALVYGGSKARWSGARSVLG